MRKFILLLPLFAFSVSGYAQMSMPDSLINEFNSRQDLYAKQRLALELCDYYIEYDSMKAAQAWVSKAKVITHELPPSILNYIVLTRQTEIFYYHHLFELGLQSAKTSFAIAEELKDSAAKCDAKFFEAIFLFEMDSMYKAKDMFNQALQFYPVKILNKTDFFLVKPLHIYNNIAECFVKLGNADSALYFNKIAFKEAQRENLKRGICNTLYTFGAIERLANKTETAIQFFRRCIEYNKETPYRDVDLLCTGKLTALYLQKKDLDSAKIWKKMADSLIAYSPVNISFKKSYYKAILTDIPDYARYSWLANTKQQKEIQDIAIMAVQEQATVELLTTGDLNEREIVVLKNMQLTKTKKQSNIIVLLLSVLFAFLIFITWFIVRGFYRRKIEKQKTDYEKQQAVEEERNRISRDMHDDMGSGLTKIAILSEVVKKQINEPEKAKEQIEKIAVSSRELVDNLQDIVWVLNPKNDTLESLSAYIREYGLKYFEPFAVQMKFNYPDEFSNINLGEEQRRNIFLTVKETFHNIAKHAWCNQITVTITENTGKIIIRIEDDGKGFDMTDVRLFANGLQNMQKRIEQSGGTYHISSAPGKGTVTELKINT